MDQKSAQVEELEWNLSEDRDLFHLSPVRKVITARGPQLIPKLFGGHKVSLTKEVRFEKRLDKCIIFQWQKKKRHV